MADTVWELTEYFEDAPAETTLFHSEAAAHADLAARARDGGLPEENFDPSDSDTEIAITMLAFWRQEMVLELREVVR